MVFEPIKRRIGNSSHKNRMTRAISSKERISTVRLALFSNTGVSQTDGRNCYDSIASAFMTECERAIKKLPSCQ